MSTLEPMKRKRRRWLVHVVWLVVAVLACWGGMEFGFRLVAGTLGSIATETARMASLRQVRTMVRLIHEDNVATHRTHEDMALRENVVSLTGVPRYGPCQPRDVAALAEARVYIAAHPLDAERPYGDLYSEGLAYCEKPAANLSRLFFLGM